MLDLRNDVQKTVGVETTLAAERASMTCFLNSLLKEWFAWSIETLPAIFKSFKGEAIHIPLSIGSLWVPIKYRSKMGRHAYFGIAFREIDQDYQQVRFEDLYDLIIQHLDVKSENPDQAKSRFRSRIKGSVEAIEEVLSYRNAELRSSEKIPSTFVEAEQSLIIGHSFHPTPKSREGFSTEDRFRFGPEYAGSFPLAWFEVKQDLIAKRSSESFGNHDWVKDIIQSDESLKEEFQAYDEPNKLLFPMHPWQASYLLNDARIMLHIDKGHIKYLGEFGDHWYPTSSVRSICRPDSPYMIKSSLNVRLTNSVRSLLTKEVDRGLQVHDVFQSRHGRELLNRYPNFHVLYEPAYWAIKDLEGSIIEESILICRTNPFWGSDTNEGLVLASLTQDHPLDEPSYMQRQVKAHSKTSKLSLEQSVQKWFDHYLDVVVEPLIMSQADYGILLGAHQQNIVIAFDDHLPSQLYFRDCQGTGYSLLGYELLKDSVTNLDPENGNILPNEMAHILFVYYLVINATFNVISTLGRISDLSEDELILSLHKKLRGLLAQNPRDKSCLEHLLTSPQIMHKGNFLCSIEDINENTAQNPLTIYTKILNPLANLERSL